MFQEEEEEEVMKILGYQQAELRVSAAAGTLRLLHLRLSLLVSAGFLKHWGCWCGQIFPGFDW